MHEPPSKRQRDRSAIRGDPRPSSSSGLGIAIGALIGAAGILIWMERYIATHAVEDFTPVFILMYGMPIAVVLGGACGGLAGRGIRKPARESLAGDLRAIAPAIVVILACLIFLRIGFLIS